MTTDFASQASSLSKTLQTLQSPDALSDLERFQLAENLDAVRAQIDPPLRALQNISLATSKHQALVAARIAMGMGVFEAFAANGGAAMTVDELDAKTKGDRELLYRILRLLAIHNLLRQTSADKFEPAPLAMAFQPGSGPGAIIQHFNDHLRSYAHLYDFLEKSGFANPADGDNSPWRFACNGEGYWSWLAARPDSQRAFNTVMAMQQQFRGQDWFEYYPVAELLRAAPDETLLVDIGGGTGHDVSNLRTRFPDLPGKLVLQDLPSVVGQIDAARPLAKGVAAQAHDMFQLQPVRGAKAYYLRTVLHDWPDREALQVLERVRDAMAPDSRLLLNENLMPAGDLVDKMPVRVDMIMMNCFAGTERTESQWIALLEEAGFRVEKVWKPVGPQGAPTALFEAFKRV